MLNPVNEIIQHRKDRAILKRTRFGFFQKIATIGIVLVLLLSYVFGITTVHGVDMSPALKDGDIVFFVRLGHEHANGDILVYEQGGKDCVSRVGATAGDTLRKGTNGQIVFNERLHPMAPDEGLYYKTMARDEIKYPITLDKGELFMLGDKRDTAEDSRSFGVISEKQVKGKVITFIRKRGL